MKLFLCDDNLEYRKLMRLVLEEEHEIVGEAGDGQEAIERAPAADPEVVLLDLNMPRMNGWEALPELRRVVPDTKIVIVTTSGAEDERDRALAAGVDGYIVKPDSVFSLTEQLAAQLAA